MREGLAEKLQGLLMRDNAFLHLYMTNCDQILTTDLEEFTTIISELFSISRTERVWLLRAERRVTRRR